MQADAARCHGLVATATATSLPRAPRSWRRMTSEVTDRSAVRARVTHASSPSAASSGRGCRDGREHGEQREQGARPARSPDPRVAVGTVTQPGGIPVRLGVGHRRTGGAGRTAPPGSGCELLRGRSWRTGGGRRLTVHRPGLLPAGRSGRAAGRHHRRRQRDGAGAGAGGTGAGAGGTAYPPARQRRRHRQRHRSRAATQRPRAGGAGGSGRRSRGRASRGAGSAGAPGAPGSPR